MLPALDLFSSFFRSSLLYICFSLDILGNVRFLYIHAFPAVGFHPFSRLVSLLWIHVLPGISAYGSHLAQTVSICTCYSLSFSFALFRNLGILYMPLFRSCHNICSLTCFHNRHLRLLPLDILHTFPYIFQPLLENSPYRSLPYWSEYSWCNHPLLPSARYIPVWIRWYGCNNHISCVGMPHPDPSYWSCSFLETGHNVSHISSSSLHSLLFFHIIFEAPSFVSLCRARI